MNRTHYAWLMPAAALSLAAGILLGRAAETWLPLLAMVLFSGGACALMRGNARFAAVQVLVVAVGSLAGYAAYHPALPAEGDYTVSGVIAEEIRLREDGQVKTMLCGVTLDGQPVPGSAYWSFYLRDEAPLPEGLAPGRRVTLAARVYHPGGADNSDGFDFREYLLQRGTLIGVYGDEVLATAGSWHPLGVAAALRDRLSRALMAVMGEEAGGYASTMLLGSRNLIPEEERQAFNRLGIAHILSVSGYHVGVLAGLLTWLLRRVHASRRLRFACTAVLLGLYCLLTGLSAPAIRAALLFLLYEFGALKHRQRSGLHLLSASWILQLLTAPALVTSLSFHLTYGAMLGLTLVSPWLEAQWSPRRGQRVWRLLCASLGAQAGILLPELYWFQELPLAGILLNVLVAAMAAGLMTLCWVVLLLLPIPPLAEGLGRLTAALVNGMLVGVRSAGQWPGITLWTCRADLLTAAGWVLLMLALSWWWRRRGRGVALLLSVVMIALSVAPWPNSRTQYVQFSVGEADAAVLQDKDTTVAIDTGEDGEALAQWLHQRRLGLDVLILTHLHIDHAGGVAALVESGIPVKVCYLPWGAERALNDEEMPALLDMLMATGTRIAYLARGDEISLPSGRLRVLWPEEGRVRPGQEANESSMALLAELHGSTMLLTGDLEGTYEMYAAQDADVLKVAHHGSEGSTSPEFLQAVSPQLLLLSCGDEQRSLSMEARRGDIPMLDTRVGGAITIQFDENGFTAETFR